MNKDPRLIRNLSFLAAAVLCFGLATAHADTPAIDFSSPSTNYTNGDWSLGWQFTVNQPIYVTALGFYDDGQDGLSENHDVGIYDSGGDLLASVTVTPTDPLISFFRYAGIAPLPLLTGQTYTIAAVTGGENYTWDPNDFSSAPEVNFVGDAFVSSNTLQFPTNSLGGTNGWFGPNFQFATTAVPEPSAAALYGIALTFILVVKLWPALRRSLT